MAPDVVFVVREGVERTEFQYALRSLRFLEHGKVWLFGGRPDWVRNVEHVPVPDSYKWRNISGKFKAAVEHPGVADEFVYTEDDYFITAPVDYLPDYARKEPLAEWVATYRARHKRKDKMTGWERYLSNTLDVLTDAGVEDPVSYDVHIPMLIQKRNVPLHLWRGPDFEVSWRTLYGNFSERETVRAPRDVKVNTLSTIRDAEKRMPGFLSSSDGTFKKSVLNVLKRVHPDPSPYEAEFYKEE